MKARRCLNELCDGPEWWGLRDDQSEEQYRPCPRCGYLCEKEHMGSQLYPFYDTDDVSVI